MMQSMKAITLRNLPPAVSREIEERARKSGLSLNKTVLRLLEERLLPKDTAGKALLGGQRHHDLDDLAGAWSEEEAAEFDRALSDERRIDPELWS